NFFTPPSPVGCADPSESHVSNPHRDQTRYHHSDRQERSSRDARVPPKERAHSRQRMNDHVDLYDIEHTETTSAQKYLEDHPTTRPRRMRSHSLSHNPAQHNLVPPPDFSRVLQDRDRLGAEVEHLRSLLTQEQARSEDLEHINRSLRRKLDRCRAKQQTTDDASQSMSRQNDMLRQELLQATTALSNERSQRKDERLLLDTRARELRDAQVFLDKADNCSVTDVIDAVRSLNSEIFQLTATIVDDLEPSFASEPGNGNQKETLLGSRMIELLTSRGNDDMREGILQIALQAVLGNCCVSSINSWHASTSPSTFLDDLYRRIKTENSQSVSGRWRAITRAHKGVNYSSDSLSHCMISKLDTVLTIAGWPSLDSSNNHGRYRERISQILLLASKVDKMLGQSITTQDILLYVVQPGVPFGSHRMSDMNGPSKVDGEEVLCAAEIGVESSESSRKDGAKIEPYILLKPGVVVHSSLMKGQ
ncbi:hypothetical protein BDZ89DRAFT_1068047, partial [Hymenopellis radicata]